MKLLRKPEVVALKEHEKAREAAEGLRIARKIDELRELQSNTEKKLNDFRDSSLRVIGEEMKNLGEQRDVLAIEVSSLQKKLDAMLPGMGTKREELAKKEKELISQAQELLKRKETLDVQEIDVVEAKKELSDLIASQKTADLSAKIAWGKAEEAKGEALSSLSSAKAIQERTEKEKQSQDAFFVGWEKELSAKEKAMKEKEDFLNAEERKLAMEKVKLEDRRQMVERTLERLRVQRINAEQTR